MDDQLPAAPTFGPLAEGPPSPASPPTHMAGRRSLPRGFAPLAALIVVVAGGGALAVATLLGEDEKGQGVELLPAAGPGRDDFAGDLDLLEPGRRARPAGERPRLPFEGVPRPSEADDQRLFWREAEPTTYKFSVAQPWKVFAEYGLGEQVPPPP